MTILEAPEATRTSPPLSRAIQTTAGVSLALGGLLNGLPQYVVEQVAGDLDDFSAQIAWGADHAAVHQTEQLALVLSLLFLPLGLLGLAQVSRWSAPRLTAVGIVLAIWGMWGFQNVLGLGYAAGSVGPDAIGVNASVDLNEGFLEHVGVMVSALLPHLLGSFLGLILLSIACWRSGLFPRIPLAMLVAFLGWDFLLPSYGLLEPHLLLTISLVWLGAHLARMPREVWLTGSR